MENQTVLTKLQSNIDLKEGESRIISIPLPQKKKRKKKSEIPKFDYENIKMLELLGKGGFGTVFKAYNIQTCRFLAMKFYSNPEKIDFEDIRSEDSLMSAVEAINQSNRFLKYYGLYKDSNSSIKNPEIDNFIVVMESGELNLKEILSERKSYPINNVLYLFKSLVFDLMVLEKNGIASRDVKTENVILVEENVKEGIYSYKICDFGIGCIVSKGDKFIDCEEMAGFTYNYAAPELKKINPDNPEGKYNPFIADVYSLGIVIIELMGYNKREFLEHKENIFYSILIKMIEENPKIRICFEDIHKELTNLKMKEIIPRDEKVYIKKYLQNKVDKKSMEEKFNDNYKNYLAYRDLSHFEKSKQILQELYKISENTKNPIHKMIYLKENGYINRAELSYLNMNFRYDEEYEELCKEIYKENSFEYSLACTCLGEDYLLTIGEDIHENVMYCIKERKRIHPYKIEIKFIEMFNTFNLRQNITSITDLDDLNKLKILQDDTHNFFQNYFDTHFELGEFEDFYIYNVFKNIIGIKGILIENSFSLKQKKKIEDNKEYFDQCKNNILKKLDSILTNNSSDKNIYNWIFPEDFPFFKEIIKLIQIINLNSADINSNISIIKEITANMHNISKRLILGINKFEAIIIENKAIKKENKRLKKKMLQIDNAIKSRDYFIKALNIRLKILGENNMETAKAYNNLAVLYKNFYTKISVEDQNIKILEKVKNFGDPNNIEKYYEKAKKFFESNNSQETNRFLAGIYENLALFYLQIKKNHDVIEELFKKTLIIREKLFGPQNIQTIRIYENLANFYVQKLEFGKSEEYYKKAIDNLYRINDENNLVSERLYTEWANLYDVIASMENTKTKIIIHITKKLEILKLYFKPEDKIIKECESKISALK